MIPGPVATFANHRGVAPLLWVFVVLASIELLAGHLLVGLKWPRGAWFLSGITALSLVWLVHWIASWKRLPHVLEGDRLRLYMGSMRKVNISLSEIACIRTAFTADELKRKGTLNLVPLAFPNRLIELREPLPGRRRANRIAIRLDDPQTFDIELGKAGIRYV